MRNFIFYTMLIAFLLCQFTIYNQKQTIDAYAIVVAEYQAVVAKYERLTPVIKDNMKLAYLEGANDFLLCDTEKDNEACGRIKQTIKELREKYND